MFNNNENNCFKKCFFDKNFFETYIGEKNYD